MRKKQSQKSEPAASVAVHTKPEFIRLPAPGEHCPYTGLTRSKMNELVLPCDQNSHKPPVRSVSMRQRGHKRGVRLIVYDSLMAYLNSLTAEGG